MFRRYKLGDIPLMLDHVEQFLEQSGNYQGLPFDRDKLRRMLVSNVSNIRFFCTVAVNDSDIVIGGLAATVQEYTFSKAVFAADLIFYVPQDKRSLKLATELVEQYVAWGKQRGVKELRLANSTGVKPAAYAKLCERFGFSYLGPIYQMRF